MKFIKIGLLLCLVVLLAPRVSASELEERLENEYCTGISDSLEQASDAQSFFNTFSSCLEDSLSGIGGSFGWLCCAVVLAAVLKAVRGSLSDGETELYDLCSALVCALVMFGTVRGAYDAVAASFTGIQSFMTAMLAAMTALYGLSGNFVSGSASVSTLMLALQVMEFIMTSVLLPLISVCFGFCLLSPFTFSTGADQLVGFIKKTVNFALVSLAAVLSIILGCQSILSKSADTAVLKGVKFSAASFIPVVGSSLSESLNAVYAALSAVRASAGIGGIISLCALILPPIIIIIVDRLLLAAMRLLCGVLKLDEIGKITEALDGVLSMLFALCASCGAVLILACALFAVY